jgi:hypothetical protein
MVEGGIVQLGKHTGERIEDLSTEYLVWFCKSVYDDAMERREWAKKELKRRGIKVAK